MASGFLFGLMLLLPVTSVAQLAALWPPGVRFVHIVARPMRPLFSEARSVLVGPHARIVGYQEKLFRDPVLELMPGTRLADVDALKASRTRAVDEDGLHRMTNAVFLLALACLLGLAACGEEPQRLEAAATAGFSTDNWNAQLRERTRHQSERERIYR